MNDHDDRITMEINIAGQNIKLSVPFASQDDVRDSEKEIQDLFNTWRLRFPKKSDHELLAMIAYQYASYYRDLLGKNRKASSIAEACNEQVKRMLGL